MLCIHQLGSRDVGVIDVLAHIVDDQGVVAVVEYPNIRIYQPLDRISI